MDHCKARKVEIKHLKDTIEHEHVKKDVNKVNQAMIKEMRQEHSEILEQLKESKKESKDLKKAVIERDKHLHNLNKDIENESDKCKQLKAKVEELTATANRDRKQKKREKSDFLSNTISEYFNISVIQIF